MVDAEDGEIGQYQVATSGKNSCSKVVGSFPAEEGLDLSSKGIDRENVKIIIEDIKEDMEYWNSNAICYVLGSNPPHTVIE